MSEGQSRWKQKFFDEVEPILLMDPLSYTLGAMEEGEVMVFKYPDVVKLAGHSCMAVSGAYKLTSKALKFLYNDKKPVRGEIKVTVKGGPQDMAYGPISQVISFITGAATETGFKGLKGNYKRQNKLTFDKDNPQFNTFIFQRIDTGKTVKITYNPQALPQDTKTGKLLSKLLSNEASREEKEEFFKLWQYNVREVLLNDEKYEGLFKLEEIEGSYI